MNVSVRYLSTVFAGLVLASGFALAQERGLSEEVEEQIRRINAEQGESPGSKALKEIQDQMELLRDWIGEQVDTAREEWEKPASPGRTITITFELTGADEPISISTAREEYVIEFHDGWDMHEEGERSEHSEYHFDVAGDVRVHEERGTVFIACHGSFTHEETIEEAGERDERHNTHVNIGASAFVQPGERTVLVKRGDNEVAVTVSLDPPL